MRNAVLLAAAIAVALAGWWVWWSAERQATTSTVSGPAEAPAPDAEASNPSVTDAPPASVAQEAVDNTWAEDAPIVATAEPSGLTGDARATIMPSEALEPENFDTARIVALIEESDLPAGEKADLSARVRGAADNEALQLILLDQLRSALGY